jgi:hypothetical protein
LRPAVFKDFEISPAEFHDGVTRPVAYRCLQHHQVYLHGNPEVFLISTVA